VASDGTIAAAQHMAPNTMYGVSRNRGDAFTATTASFRNSLRIVRYGKNSEGAICFCKPRAALVDPADEQRRNVSAMASCSS